MTVKINYNVNKMIFDKREIHIDFVSRKKIIVSRIVAET